MALHRLALLLVLAQGLFGELELTIAAGGEAGEAIDLGLGGGDFAGQFTHIAFAAQGAAVAHLGAPGERTATTDLLAPDGDDLPASADATDFAASHHQIGHNQGAPQQIIDDFGVTGFALHQGGRHADDALTTGGGTIVAATADGVERQKGSPALTALFEGGNSRLGIIPIAGDDVLQAGA